MKEWFKCAGIRALKTISQAMIGAIGGSAMFSEVNWTVVISTGLLAGIMSLLMSIAGLPELETDKKRKK